MRRTLRAKMQRKLTEFIAAVTRLRLTAVASFAAVSFLLIFLLLFPASPFFSLKLRLFFFHTPRIYDPSCNSRPQLLQQQQQRSFPKPSPYFLSKLRRYEDLHRRCGPLSQSFNPNLNHQLNGYPAAGGAKSDCKYIIYTPSQGLGNRILGLSSTFLYGLLTDRVVLVEFGSDMGDLFCEPFLNSTWYLPETFPFRFKFYTSGFKNAYSYGSILKRNNREPPLDSSPAPSMVQIFLHDKYDEYDKLFFKDEYQPFLQRVPWLIVMGDGYSIPCLFQMKSFRSELTKLFPDEGKVFHHLGRYLFSPSNQAWELITRFHDAYLANSEEKIGIQIRVFEPRKIKHSVVMNQILNCTQKEKILPIAPPSNRTTTKSVLIASLSSKFYEEIKSKYGKTGSGIGVYQASHEEKQYSNDLSHNMKAWADIYLLSMSNKLVTSSKSTFGYVAAGLGALRPWIVMNPDPEHGGATPEPSCERGWNLEPCFHFPPWFAYPDQPGDHVGNVGRCEDVPWGLKLVDGYNGKKG
ncbi:Galactoside 2-alpha-L-fucosyltransferase [Linum grandiflorum]